MNCVHGIDSRFCAVCNKVEKAPRSRKAVAAVSVEDILRFLNAEQVRATYGAVAEVLGVIPRSMGARLGPRRPEASWIVSGFNGFPTDYGEDEWHSALLSQAEIITSGRVLALRLAKWRAEARQAEVESMHADAPCYRLTQAADHDPVDRPRASHSLLSAARFERKSGSVDDFFLAVRQCIQAQRPAAKIADEQRSAQ